MEDTTTKRYKNIKNITNSYAESKRRSSGTMCLVCKNVSAYEVVKYYDQIRQSDSEAFLDSKLICNSCLKKIKKDYNAAIKKEELLCNLGFYIDNVYSIQLKHLPYESKCSQVDEGVKKQLINIANDYDQMLTKRENKTK